MRYKSQDHVDREYHISAHAYVKDPKTHEFRRAIVVPEKPEKTEKRSGKTTWPDNAELNFQEGTGRIDCKNARGRRRQESDYKRKSG